MVQQMGGLARFKQQTAGGRPGTGRGGIPHLPSGVSREQIMQMQNMLPPEIKAQLRQPGGREKLMQQMHSGQLPLSLIGGMPGMGSLGVGGMPDLGS